MGPVNKRINFAFDIGERVWLVCDPNSSGIIDGYRVGLGYLPKYIVAFANGKSTHCEPNMFGSETTTWSQGCLCNRWPEYAKFNKWNWGFACVDVANEGSFDLMNFRMSSDYEVRTA